MVRYGRRRQRNRQPAWGQGGGGFQGWKDRAPPVSYGRQVQFPHPNRPAPPPRDSRPPGPRFRSYAEAVRTNLATVKRVDPPEASGPEVRRQPADPQLGKLIRKLHAVVRLVHHLQNVAPKPGKPEPRMISRMVEVLSGMIKPAVPTRHTEDLIVGNAKNWGHTTYLILKQHYEDGLENLLGELSGILTPDWKEAFAVAVRWAKRNLPRLSQDVIDHAEALIAGGVEQTTGAAEVPPPQQTGGNTAQIQVPRQAAVGTSVATMTDQVFQEPDENQVPSQTELPLAQRGVRRRPRTAGGVILTENGIIREPESTPADEVRGEWESPVQGSVRSDLEALFDELEAEEKAAEAMAAQADKALTTVTAQVIREAGPEEEVFEESFDHFTSPEPTRYSVRRHPNTQRKLTDWDLVVTKKWLIIGDSNLSKFPDYFNKGLQVESYPGSHFRHGQALMEKTLTSTLVTVEKVVLAFGINSRGNKPDTTIKNVQGAIRSAKRKFPYAEVWIPLVNFSPQLSEEEKENLEILNNHIERNMPHIPLLPEHRFQTEVDDVHWTSETASAILDHWMTFLNSNTP